VAQSFSFVPLAAILRRIFDVVLPAHDLRLFLAATAALLGIQLAGLAIAWWIRTRALEVSHLVLAQLRSDAAARLYDLPRSFFTAADVEHLHVTLVHETQDIEQMNYSFTALVLPGLFACLLLFLILFRIERVYALIVAGVAPPLLVLNRALVRRAWFRQEGVRRAWEKFSRGIRFAISAIELTRSHAAEPYELRRQVANIERLRRISLDLNRFDSNHQAVQGAMLLTSTLLVLLAGGWSVAQGWTTTGDIMAFYVIAALFSAQARTLVEAVPAIRRGIRAFHGLARFLENPEREPYSGSRTVPEIVRLSLEGVSFRYEDGAPLLEDVSLDLRRGDRVALLGPNGSGKSTVVHLLAGYIRPQRGAASANGIAYDEIDIRSLRGRMAVAPQHPFLFTGTVRENVAYAMSECEDAAIEEALEWAGAAAFVHELPRGLDEPIGEQGARLSGGQRQKLAIARALLRRPDVLILDEPTNHLDDESIAALLATLAALPFRPAVLLISHDWRVLQHAGTAWHLENGRIAATAAGQRR